jgi:DNA excision repair protein ERCC-2
MPKGIYTLDDLREFGKKQGMCPYFLARHFLLQSNVIVYNYSYMLDPKISNLVSKELQKDCIVVFDECHNIDNACIEAFSLNLNRRTLELASANLKRLDELVREEKRSNTERLQAEYRKLIRGLFNE